MVIAANTWKTYSPYEIRPRYTTAGNVNIDVDRANVMATAPPSTTATARKIQTWCHPG
jgi:hypothetical protein